MPGPRHLYNRSLAGLRLSPKPPSRRRPHALAGLASTLSLGLLGCGHQPTGTPANVRLLETEIYLTEAPARGDEGDFAGVLLLVNGAGGPLRIDNVRTDCGCTAAEWPRGSAAPGDTLRVPVVLDCRRSGYVEQEVEVWVEGLRGPLRALVTAECP